MSKRTLKLIESSLKESEEYRYITSHGIGPGAIPKGTYVRSEDLPNGKTAIYTNRPLSDEELKKYDIKPEWIQEEVVTEDTILGTETPEERKAKEDSKKKGLYSEKEDLTEDIDTGVDDEGKTAEDAADDIQDETPAEEEEESSELDNQLEELREVLVDLDLNLYQVTNKENPNEIFYFIGKVDEDSDDVLMLVDQNPTEDSEEPSVIDNELPEDEEDDKEIDDLSEDEDNTPVEDITNPEDESDENRFDFVKIPLKYEDFVKMNPRYGDELNPNHEDIMEYLMKCLVEVNPERAEEISAEKEVPEDDGASLPLDQDFQSDIDNKIEHYSNNLNK